MKESIEIKRDDLTEKYDEMLNKILKEEVINRDKVKNMLERRKFK